jgi:1A family penicillin-binding protein
MKNKNNQKIIKVFKIFLEIILGIFFALFFALVIFIFINIKDLPRPEKFTESIIPQSTKIYDRTGKVVLYEIAGDIKSEYVNFQDVPSYLKEAILSIEDKDFYNHKGIDLKSILRAILVDIKLKKPAQGGSTITQQLVRTYFLTREKTIKRKTQEIILALELEKQYSKDQIFEWYLNVIPFGENLYGVQAASQAYFGKSVQDLNLNQCVILAAMIKSPTMLSPWGDNINLLLERKNLVLDKMQELGYISKEEKELAKNEKIEFQPKITKIIAPHFVFYVKDYLEKKYGKDYLETAGLKVITTLDLDIQKIAQDSIKEKETFLKQYNAHNAALVAINAKTGEILAMVGSKDWFASPYPPNCQPGKNCKFEPWPNVTILPRQPGSAFKPFVYVTAFEKGYSDKYVVLDEETNFGTENNPYIPQNYDGKFRGPVTLREALAQSLNVPSVKVLRDLAGLSDSIETARKLGITTLNKPMSFYGLSIVLGGAEVKLLDMVAAYSVFANDGYKIPLTPILKIEDSKGNLIEEKTNYQPIKLLSSKSVRLLNDVLSDNKARAPIFGWHSFLYFENYQVAVKTGTTQNWRDAWTIGYTPSLVAGVWVGNNDNTPMNGLPGVLGAGNVWHAFMEKVLPKFPKEYFPK